MAAAPAAVAPPRGKGLAHYVVDELGSRIRDATLRPGARLPTEAALVARFGVSRTVVREAISSLQASGLVQTLHGVGTFVLEPPAPAMLHLDPSEVVASIDVMAVLELRISLETGAAGLAASRRTPVQLAAMREALDGFERHIAQCGDGVADDMRFHRLIAESTANPYFAEIMDHVGSALIPRTRIPTERGSERSQQYLARVNREHEEIYAAIARSDAESARAAMRVHLTNSRERLRLAREAAQPERLRR